MAVKHKILILILKYIPMLLALLYVINTLLKWYNPALTLGWLCGTSLISLIFLYIASYAFSFCSYHRIFLHYIAIIELINWLDWIFEFPLSIDIFILIQLFLFIICAFIALYLHMKENEIRIIKTRTQTVNKWFRCW